MLLTSILFLPCAGIGIIMSLVPLVWHLEATNVGTCAYMVWTAIILAIEFVGTIVWNGNAINWAPVYCDIITRIRLAGMIAWSACCLCIVRRLHSIATITNVTTTPAEKRRQMIIDLFITIGLPLFFSLLQLVCSGHRFDIFENFGCYSFTYNTPVAFVLVWTWPLIITLITGVYGILTVHAFMKRRKRFKDLVTATGLNWNRYYRLVLLAVSDLTFGLPLSIWFIWLQSTRRIFPWISWEDTHSKYNRADQIPWVLIEQYLTTRVVLETNRWIGVLCALLFFAFFGFAEEAKQNYRLFASTVTKRLGITTFTQSTVNDPMGSQGSVSFPVFITQQVASKRGSLDSFSDKLSTSITVGEYDLKVRPQSSAEQPISSSSSSVMPAADEVPRVPEPVLDPASARKPSVPDAPKSVHPDNDFDQV